MFSGIPLSKVSKGIISLNSHHPPPLAREEGWARLGSRRCGGGRESGKGRQVQALDEAGCGPGSGKSALFGLSVRWDVAPRVGSVGTLVVGCVGSMGLAAAPRVGRIGVRALGEPGCGLESAKYLVRGLVLLAIQLRS